MDKIQQAIIYNARVNEKEHKDLETKIKGVSDSSADACSVDTIDTTTAENITVTAQWNNAKTGNIFTLTQGFLEYKN